MTRAYNFSPGPAALPDEVMRAAQAEFCEYRDWRASVAEVSHRDPRYLRLWQETESLLRELLDVPESHWILFLQGGATGQMAAAPLNLLGEKRLAAYVITGHWSRRAAREAERYCAVHVAADTAADNHAILPRSLDAPSDAAYLHYAANETVHGVEFAASPPAPAPLVADMSSNILSRPLRIVDYGMIYAGAQKNIGIAGATVVIVRADLVNPRPATPSVWNYALQRAADSMLNTPPTFQIYMLGLVLRWAKAQGGVAALSAAADKRARMLYGCLDASDFYQTPVVGDCRSRMNAPFFLPSARLTEMFLTEAEERGLIGLKGHKVMGGCRASLYNAMPIAGVAALVDHLRDFEKRRG